MLIGALIPLRASTSRVVSARNFCLFLRRPGVRLRGRGTPALGLPSASSLHLARLPETVGLWKRAELVLILALVAEGALSPLELVAQTFSLAIIKDRWARWRGQSTGSTGSVRPVVRA